MNIHPAVILFSLNREDGRPAEPFYSLHQACTNDNEVAPERRYSTSQFGDGAINAEVKQLIGDLPEGKVLVRRKTSWDNHDHRPGALIDEYGGPSYPTNSRVRYFVVDRPDDLSPFRLWCPDEEDAWHATQVTAYYDNGEDDGFQGTPEERKAYVDKQRALLDWHNAVYAHNAGLQRRASTKAKRIAPASDLPS